MVRNYQHKTVRGTLNKEAMTAAVKAHEGG